MAVRVVLAEDHALLREGLARLIESDPRLELAGAAADLPEILALIERVAPDVVVTDIRMPPTGTDEGIQLAARLRAERADVGVVVLSQYAEPAYVLALLAEGSAGRAYLLKERVAGVDDLVHAICEVAGGGSVIDPAVVETLVSASARRQPSDLDRLTQRESEILGEMAQGKSNAAIGATLALSEPVPVGAGCGEVALVGGGSRPSCSI